MTAKHRGTTVQRGLGYMHKQQVRHLKSVHVEGSPCWWCGDPMYIAQGLHGDHSIPRSQGGTVADRLLHGPCNTARGDGTRDDARPALTGRITKHEVPDLGTRVLHWPS